MSSRYSLATLAGLLSYGSAAVTGTYSSRCTSFGASLAFPNTTVLHTTYYPDAQNFTLPGADPTCQLSAENYVPLCRIAMLVDTTDSSQVVMEAWLPDKWSGRVGTVGNGGLGGCIDYSQLAYLSDFNFAVIGTNNGHNGTSGLPFLNAPEVVTDFAWRAIHTAAEMIKPLTADFYSKEIGKAYYVGCSTGGRQGFRAIQDFPEDFDGVLAGAPAMDFNHLSGWDGVLGAAVGAPADVPLISRELWEVVRLDALDQCDGIDGLLDGIIDDPDRCDYRAERILCDSDEKNTTLCLSAHQAEIVNKVFTPLYGKEGELLFPRYDPGTSFQAAGWLVFSGAVFPYAMDWWRYVIYNDPTFSGTNWTIQQIYDADAVDPDGISTYKPDISAFASRGGKVLQYHGTQDSLIPQGNSQRYHLSVRRELGPDVVDGFYRYFAIPGMDHCSGGPGPNTFGQIGRSYQGLPKNRTHNALLALVDWVENGNSVEELVITKFRDDVAGGEKMGTRRVCAWPKRSVSTGKEKGWKCVD